MGPSLQRFCRRVSGTWADVPLQVKPNIGHSEAASGIFAVMKAALMTEAAVIPGVALLDKLNPDSMPPPFPLLAPLRTPGFAFG